MRYATMGIVLGVGTALAAPAGLDEPLTFAKIETWVKANPDAKLEDALGALPETVRKSAVWVTESDSAQLATAETPRGILHSPTGKLTLAFSGHPNDPKRHRLEMLQFDDTTKKFEMREIDFGQKPPAVSAANPPGCLKCHGEDPRPNWSAYPTWPGVFGKEDFKDSEDEHRAYAKFADAKKSDPRYGKFFLKERETFPEKPNENPSQRERRLTEWRRSNLSNVNSKLTDFFAGMNFQRLARLATASRLGNQLVPLIASLLNECQPMKNAFPDSWADFAKKLEEATPTRKDDPDSQLYREEIERVQLLLASLGEHTADWTMNFDRRKPFFSTPYFAPNEFLGALMEKHAVMKEVFTTPKALVSKESGGEYRSDASWPKENVDVCAKLAEASRKELAKVEPPKVLGSRWKGERGTH